MHREGNKGARCILEKQCYNHGNGTSQPSTVCLIETFDRMARQMNEVRVVMDALDECDAGTATSVNHRAELLEWLQKRIKHQGTDHCKIRVIMTSRSNLTDVQSQLELVLPRSLIISIENESTKADIQVLIRGRLLGNSGFSRWQTPEEKPYLQHIEEMLLEKSNLMFRWADLQLNKLERLDSKDAMNKALQKLPKGLDEFYARSLHEVQEEHRDDATLLLQFLLYSSKPPLVSEVLHAMTIDPHLPAGKSIEPDKLMSEDMKPLSPLMSNLVTFCDIDWLDPASRERRSVPRLEIAHSSVKDYLISLSHGRWRHKFQETIARADILRICLASLGTLAVGHPDCTGNLLDHVRHNLTSHARFPGVEKEAHDHIMKFLILNGLITQSKIASLLMDRSYAGLPLYVCSALGLKWTLQQLLKNGVDPNEAGGESSLIEASASPYYERLITKFIPKDLITKNIPDSPKESPASPHKNALCAACFGGHNEVVRLLLDNGAKIEVTLDIDEDPLLSACQEVHHNVIETLLERWPEDKFKCQILGRALIQACHSPGSRGTQSVRLLLDNGADLNSNRIPHGTALHVASLLANEAQVQLLIAAGANVNSQGGMFGTALQAACNGFPVFGCPEAVIKTLLQHKADPNAQGGFYKNALSAAGRERNKEAIRLLLEYRASLDYVDGQYRGPVEEVIGEMENEKKNNTVVTGIS